MKKILLIATLFTSITGFIFVFFQAYQHKSPLDDNSPCRILVAYDFPQYDPRQKGHYYFCKTMIALEYSPRAKTPMWVAEKIKKEHLAGETERESNFYVNNKLLFWHRATLEDYRGSGYDRGHMAPAGNFTKNDIAMKESFYLTNIAPQVGEGMNRGIWMRLEVQIRRWARMFDTVYTITGPIYENGLPKERIGKNRVAVPTHFYKIVYIPKLSEYAVFIMPNERIPHNKFENYMTSLDVLEKKTGIFFFPLMPNNIRNNGLKMSLWE